MCKRELPIEMFNKSKNHIDRLHCYCKQCNKVYSKKYNNKILNTFQGELKTKRGQSLIVKRDYELTEKQLNRREYQRQSKKCSYKKTNQHGILIWYDEKLNELDYELYVKVYKAEYGRQRRCAICGCIGKKKPSEHFLFDFDLEQMLKDNAFAL